MALITDAMRVPGMPEGESILGSLKNGLRVILATADRLVRTMINIAGVSLTDTIRMITETPARIMGITEKGSLQAGKDADILIFIENINIRMTMVKGMIVDQKSAEREI